MPDSPAPMMRTGHVVLPFELIVVSRKLWKVSSTFNPSMFVGVKYRSCLYKTFGNRNAHQQCSHSMFHQGGAMHIQSIYTCRLRLMRPSRSFGSRSAAAYAYDSAISSVSTTEVLVRSHYAHPCESRQTFLLPHAVACMMLISVLYIF